MPAPTLIDLLAPVSDQEISWGSFSALADFALLIGHDNLWCQTHGKPALSMSEYASIMQGYREASKNPMLERLKHLPVAQEISLTGIGCEAERDGPKIDCVFIDRRTLPQFKFLDPADPDFDRHDAHLLSTMDHECG